jgi:hypothetical protein
MQALIRLTRIHPLVFLMVYLCLLPTFAFLYTYGCPDGFYAPYAHLEPAWTSDTVKLEAMLAKRIAKSVRKKEYIIEPSGVTVRNLTIKPEGRISFELFVSKLLPSPDGYIPSANFIDLTSFYTIEKAAQQLDGNVLEVEMDVPGFKVVENRNVLTDLCSGFFLDGEQIDSWRVALENGDFDQLRAYIHGFNGAASGVGGNFWRMLYLSSVVVTTLGLGDIIPITPLARFFVGLQAVSGILLIGLFLNAVAYQASQPGRR